MYPNNYMPAIGMPVTTLRCEAGALIEVAGVVTNISEVGYVDVTLFRSGVTVPMPAAAVPFKHSREDAVNAAMDNPGLLTCCLPEPSEVVAPAESAPVAAPQPERRGSVGGADIVAPPGGTTSSESDEDDTLPGAAPSGEPGASDETAG